MTPCPTRFAAPDASRLKNSKTSRPFERMGQNMVADKPRAVPKVNVGFIVIWEADSRCPMPSSRSPWRTDLHQSAWDVPSTQSPPVSQSSF